MTKIFKHAHRGGSAKKAGLKQHLLAGLALTIGGLAAASPAKADNHCMAAFDNPNPKHVAVHKYGGAELTEAEINILAGADSYDDCVIADMPLLIVSDKYSFAKGDINPLTGKVLAEDSEIAVAAGVSMGEDGFANPISFMKWVNGEVVSTETFEYPYEVVLNKVIKSEVELAKSTGKLESLLSADNPNAKDDSFAIYHYNRLQAGQDVLESRLIAEWDKQSITAPAP